MNFQVVIVGAGPAGLAAAYELSKRNVRDILVIDQGKAASKRQCPMPKNYNNCAHCDPCSIMCGIGGAGTYSSGLLNLNPYIGGDLTEFTNDEREAWELVNLVDQMFLENGAPDILFKPNREKVEELERKASSADVKFIPIDQRLIGTDNACAVIERIHSRLEGWGVKFLLETRVAEVKEGELLLEGGDKVEFEYCILAPGRSGMKWLEGQMSKLGIPTQYLPVDIGVRVEVPASIMEPVCSIEHDPKFHIRTSTFDDFVRTFCVNHKGFVVMEVYEDHVGVNGYSFTNKTSDNTNFALLVRVGLTEPLEDTTAYGRSIATQITILGGGKPLLQRLGDLRRGRRSYWSRIERGAVKPTLMSVTPGDVSIGIPYRLLTDILEGLEKLDRVIPGIASDSTLFYAPEIKYSAKKVLTNKSLETKVSNLFVAGDGAGVSRGIVTAAATGIVAARGIIKKME
ncbi:MAG: NAD(P)/FAD-dependent oxidoreductase [Candidatus Freyarchaeota archaeon]|nr:NAD(P)/FAD-dependent oxidoreductase [Candidatus Jordarchaeia archaeon]MBS7280568.1 NAD(P)/FAD-dependent oxidoreductase [Candidatus Jordarchaeia archaeon]